MNGLTSLVVACVGGPVCPSWCVGLLSLLCPLCWWGDPRLYVCQAPGALICVSPCGSILGPVWVQFGSILGPFWVHFGSILGPFWVHLGSKNRYLDKNQYLHKNQ